MPDIKDTMPGAGALAVVPRDNCGNQKENNMSRVSQQTKITGMPIRESGGRTTIHDERKPGRYAGKGIGYILNREQGITLFAPSRRDPWN
jgi:hypothetical protein